MEIKNYLYLSDNYNKAVARIHMFWLALKKDLNFDVSYDSIKKYISKLSIGEYSRSIIWRRLFDVSNELLKHIKTRFGEDLNSLNRFINTLFSHVSEKEKLNNLNHVKNFFKLYENIYSKLSDYTKDNVKSYTYYGGNLESNLSVYYKDEYLIDFVLMMKYLEKELFYDYNNLPSEDLVKMLSILLVFCYTNESELITQYWR